MKNKFILFDFDGVIVDSFQIAFEVKKMICPNVTEEDNRKIFEGNINDVKVDPIKHDEKCRHDIKFFEEYNPRMRNSAVMIPGIDEAIKELSKDYSMIIISSSISDMILDLLKVYKIDQYFLEIMGNDIHTSKVEKIKKVFSKYNTDAEHCVFVTDTLGDIREANVLNVKSIGVSWGFHEKERLEIGKPFKIIHKPDELPEAVNGSY